MKKVCMALWASFFFTNIYAANDIQHKITLKQAHALIWAASSPRAQQLPSIEIIPTDKDLGNITSYKSRFLFFSVISNASDGVSYYAIDSYTGDVFDPNGDCFELINKRLNVLQKKIRYSLHLTDTKYHKIKTRGPSCIE